MTTNQVRACIGEDGESREFEFRYDATSESVLAYVPGHYDDYIFELDLDLRGDATVNIMNYGSFYEYARLGIPEQAIVFASQVLGCAVYSHRAQPEFSYGNNRAEVATKVWQRLVALGGATYDGVDDRFRSI